MIKAYQSAHIANRIQQWADENNLSTFVWATVKEGTNELAIAVDYFDDEREGSRAILEKKFPEFLGDGIVTEIPIRYGAIVTYDRHDTTVLNIKGRAEYMLNYFTEDMRFVITEHNVEPEEVRDFLKANPDWAMHYENDDIIIEVR